jgi:hypothetical protein
MPPEAPSSLRAVRRWLKHPIEVVRVGEGCVFIAIVVLLLPSGAARGAVMVISGAVTAVVAALIAFNVDGARSSSASRSSSLA